MGILSGLIHLSCVIFGQLFQRDLKKKISGPMSDFNVNKGLNKSILGVQFLQVSMVLFQLTQPLNALALLQFICAMAAMMSTWEGTRPLQKRISDEGASQFLAVKLHHYNTVRNFFFILISLFEIPRLLGFGRIVSYDPASFGMG